MNRSNNAFVGWCARVCVCGLACRQRFLLAVALCFAWDVGRADFVWTCYPGWPPSPPATSGRGVCLTTPKGSLAAGWEDLQPDWSPEAVDAFDRMTLASYPYLQRIESATIRYNCHGFTVEGGWSWIDSINFGLYLTDTSYTPTGISGFGPPSPSARAHLDWLAANYDGLIIVYGDSPVAVHSGQYAFGGCEISKLGSAGLYYFPIGLGPFAHLPWTAYRRGNLVE